MYILREMSSLVKNVKTAPLVYEISTAATLSPEAADSSYVITFIFIQSFKLLEEVQIKCRKLPAI